MFTTGCTECGKELTLPDTSRWVTEKYGEQCPPCSDRLAGERIKLARAEAQQARCRCCKELLTVCICAGFSAGHDVCRHHAVCCQERTCTPALAHQHAIDVALERHRVARQA